MCLLRDNFPHHGAVSFGHHGKALFEVFKYLDAENMEGFNQPKKYALSNGKPVGII